MKETKFANFDRDFEFEMTFDDGASQFFEFPDIEVAEDFYDHFDIEASGRKPASLVLIKASGERQVIRPI